MFRKSIALSILGALGAHMGPSPTVAPSGDIVHIKPGRGRGGKKTTRKPTNAAKFQRAARKRRNIKARSKK